MHIYTFLKHILRVFTLKNLPVTEFLAHVFVFFPQVEVSFRLSLSVLPLIMDFVLLCMFVYLCFVPITRLVRNDDCCVNEPTFYEIIVGCNPCNYP